MVKRSELSEAQWHRIADWLPDKDCFFPLPGRIAPHGCAAGLLERFASSYRLSHCRGRAARREGQDGGSDGEAGRRSGRHHLHERLLQPERLETVLAAVLDRKEQRAERRRKHIAELIKRAAESELRLKRLYDAIEAGVADLDDSALKESHRRPQGHPRPGRCRQGAGHTPGLKSEGGGPEMLRQFATTARQRIPLEGGGYRRDRLRALAQRVEAAEGEVLIMGSKSRLLQTLVANGSVNSVPTQGPKWRSTRSGANPSLPCTSLHNREIQAFSSISGPL